MAALSGEVDTSPDKILDLGAALFNNLIYEQVRRRGDCDAEVTRHLVRVELCDPSHKKLEKTVQRLAEELDENVEIKKMLNDSALQPTKDVFIKVADNIFSDKKVSCANLMVFLWFASRFATKSSSTDISVIRNVQSWTMSYIEEHASKWIWQGVWEGIRSYFGIPTWKTVGLCLAGVITSVLVIYKLRQ